MSYSTSLILPSEWQEYLNLGRHDCFSVLHRFHQRINNSGILYFDWDEVCNLFQLKNLEVKRDELAWLFQQSTSLDGNIESAQRLATIAILKLCPEAQSLGFK